MDIAVLWAGFVHVGPGGGETDGSGIMMGAESVQKCTTRKIIRKYAVRAEYADGKIELCNKHMLKHHR